MSSFIIHKNQYQYKFTYKTASMRIFAYFCNGMPGRTCQKPVNKPTFSFNVKTNLQQRTGKAQLSIHTPPSIHLFSFQPPPLQMQTTHNNLYDLCPLNPLITSHYLAFLNSLLSDSNVILIS